MASSLHHYFQSVTRKAFERHGFAYADILVNWPAIAGCDLASASTPERIRWPRDAWRNGAKGRQFGGTLIVRVGEGRALELQHRAVEIIDRVNRYYGYQAIAELKVIQGPIAPQRNRATPTKNRLSATEKSKLEARLEPIEDDRLRASLRALGKGVLGRHSGA